MNRDRILITGATGFVGARVLRKLLAQQRDVAVLLREKSNTRRIDDLLGHCRVIRGELRDLEFIRRSIVEFSPCAVLHLAWDGVKGADRNQTVQLDNISSSINLYRLTEAVGCGHFVGLGSQAEYGLLSGRINEDAPTRPTTLYGAAKLATGISLERAAAISGSRLVWLRLFSSYGPDDDPSWLIPYLIRSLLEGNRPSLTMAEQLWDYLYVDDVASAIVSALDSDAKGFFNLGSGYAHPLRDIVFLIRDLIDPTLPLGFGDVAYRPDQVMHLEADISRIVRQMSWQPSVPLKEGLTFTVEWWKERLSLDYE